MDGPGSTRRHGTSKRAAIEPQGSSRKTVPVIMAVEPPNQCVVNHPHDHPAERGFAGYKSSTEILSQHVSN